MTHPTDAKAERLLSSDALRRALEEFLAEATQASVLEEGEETFCFTYGSASAHYSISAENGRCLLHLWSPERNQVRRVLDLETRKEALRLTVQRFGRNKPTHLEIVRSREHRPPSAQKALRTAYLRLLERVLERGFPDWSCGGLSNRIDLERSFSPLYARGLLQRGRSACAALGVSGHETQAAVDAAVTFGLLWLEHCRRRETRMVVEGLKLFLPAGRSAIVRERMACLDHSLAKLELYELDERDKSLEEVDSRDRGNIATRLVRYADPAAARERFAEPIQRVRELLLGYARATEIAVLSPVEVAFRWHGLEFARARLTQPEGATEAHRNEFELVFGTGHHETVLHQGTEAAFCALVRQVIALRRPQGTRADALYRIQAERWLESLVVRDVTAIEGSLLREPVYSQVPAFSASDRAMLDVLAVNGEGRLAVLELKADEDIHLPLQGLDYWARVAWHHARGEFQRFGYFPGRDLSELPPSLYLVAPALHIHPATDTLLRYFSPEIDCTLVGIDERWREEVKVVFRKRNKA